MAPVLAFQILGTALLTALLTWCAAWWMYRQRLEGALQAQLESIQSEFEARVRAGVLAAGEELLPAFREQVKLGFQDALKETQTGELVESYAGVVNRGADLLASRLGNLFGLKPKK